MIRPKQRNEYRQEYRQIKAHLNLSEQADLNDNWRSQMTPAQWGIFEFYRSIAKQRCS